MYLTKEKKAEIFSAQGFERKATDTGSPESQIALLTYRITQLTDHLREHKKDNSTRLGMLKLIGQRKALLKYLQDNNIERYRAIIKELGLRK